MDDLDFGLSSFHSFVPLFLVFKFAFYLRTPCDRILAVLPRQGANVALGQTTHDGVGHTSLAASFERVQGADFQKQYVHIVAFTEAKRLGAPKIWFREFCPPLQGMGQSWLAL